MNRNYDVIILGGGPAGYTAALYAVRAGFSTLVMERIAPGGQMNETTHIDNYPGYPQGIDGFTLGQNMLQGATRFGADTHYTEVLSVDFQDAVKKIHTADGTYGAKAVVIATGAGHKQLGLPGEKALTGKGVAYCAACDGNFYRGKTVAVVGGGNSAAADALLLSRIAKKVYLIHRRDSLRATKVYHEPLLQADNVEFCWNSEVAELLENGRLTGVTLRNVKSGQLRQISLDGLFISIGRTPATQPFQNAVALDEFGYVVAGESTETSVPGVYAAGDVRTKAVRQIVTAAADGAVAAHFLERYLAEA